MPNKCIPTLVFAGLIAAGGSLSSIAHADTLEGKVREVGGGPFGKGRATLKTEAGTFELRGANEALGVELVRLSKMIVQVTGQPQEGSVFLVDSYEIKDVGGGVVPRLGHFAALTVDGAFRLLFVDDTGQADLLPKGWAKKMKRHVGSKVWVVGARKGEVLHPRRWGILRPARTRAKQP